MNGLLPTEFDDPRNQGLLGAALAMLAASGPSPQKRTFGQILGGAGLQGMQQYDQARVLRQRDEELARRNRLVDMQITKLQQAADKGLDPNFPANVQTALWYKQASPEERQAFDNTVRAQQIRDFGGVNYGYDPSTNSWGQVVPIDQLLSNIRKTVGAKEGTEQETRAQYDLGTYTDPATGRQVLSNRLNALRGAGLVTQPQSTAQSPAQFPRVTQEQQATRDGDRLRLLLEELRDERNPVAQEALRREIGRTEQGRLPYAAGPVAQPAAPQLAPATKDREALVNTFIKDASESAKAARAARKQIGTLNDIQETLAKEVNVGPGAKFSQYGGQILVKAGVAGRNEQEKVANTRVLIQQLAEIDLEASKMLEGQGQVSNFERQMVQKAAAGEIQEMTKPELLALLRALNKTRRAKIQSHSEMLGRAPEMLNTEMFGVEMPPELGPLNEVDQTQQPKPAPSGRRNIRSTIQWGQ